MGEKNDMKTVIGGHINEWTPRQGCLEIGDVFTCKALAYAGYDAEFTKTKPAKLIKGMLYLHLEAYWTGDDYAPNIPDDLRPTTYGWKETKDGWSKIHKATVQQRQHDSSRGTTEFVVINAFRTKIDWSWEKWWIVSRRLNEDGIFEPNGETVSFSIKGNGCDLRTSKDNTSWWPEFTITRKMEQRFV